ncbi:PucR family transcriptional regulator [Amycolatopsis sp. 195334CR]|uniref:PucR family transcriptional regulator n=1 Tax=Amycolatopsis sp. 195334CR TaxID=2814588 RepID=UPI001A906687|nr:PucR family transcriptional regulator [Amycolatopsis sp. 195334CR]MBN6041024.1 PucR family transcriptional regulator [Amycolatopsis sp. 195334CR]
MGVSLRWLLDRPELGLRLVAGAAGAGRPLVFAHSIDLADPCPWLSGGELVLTTGAHLPANPREYVEGLHRAGVAALGFGIGLSHAEIPQTIVDTADELGLPLVEIPLPTPFAAITKAVLERIAEQRYEEVLRVSRAQPRMTRAALKEGAAGIVRELSAATGAATVFLGTDKEPEAAKATVDDIADVVALVREDVTGAAVVREGRAVSVQTVGVGAAVHGWLGVVGDRALGQVEQVLLGHAASLLALDREKPRRLRGERNRLGATLFGLLLSDPTLEPQLRPQFADIVDNHGIRVLTTETDLPAIDAALAERDLPLLAQETEHETLVLLPGGFTQASLPELTKAGLSSPHPLSELPQALAQARLAAASDAGLAEFTELAGATLLATPASRAVLDTVAGATIAKLDPVLITSLRTFLELNGQWEAAAASIGVHRHTLRNRLDRIGELLGRDLGSARVRAELLLAVLAWESRQR